MLPTMLTTTITSTTTTIELTGDLDASVVDAFAAALAAVETATVVIDVSSVTTLGMAGAGLVYGAFRTAPWGVEVACMAGAWDRTMTLLARGAMPVWAARGETACCC